MGAVGLSFGSPTSGAGFNVATTVSAIVANMAAAETPYQTQLTGLQSQDTVISNLGTLMSTLSTDMENLTGATGVLSSLEGSSSNTDVLGLTSAGTGAVAGSHTITVQQLAQTSSVFAGAVASTDALGGSLSIQVGTGTAVVVPVVAGATSLSDFAAAINASSSGVTASVITGTAGAQLSLTSGTSGATGGITVDASQLNDTTTGTALSFKTAQLGQDAMMTVDGISASSPSNTVSSVIPGVTFQLLDKSATPVQVQITNNTTSVGTAVSTFVSDYNAVVKALTAQEANSASGTPEPLYGNPLIATIQEGLNSAISSSQGSPSAAINLSSAGISVNSDGTLTINSDTLSTALNSNFSSIVSLFQTAGGVGESLASEAINLGSQQPNGVLSLSATANASEEKDLNATLTILKANISTQSAQLTANLNAANETLQLIPTQLNEVNELYSAITGYGQTTNG
jgi:flagellar hook-associated protein 2